MRGICAIKAKNSRVSGIIPAGAGHFCPSRLLSGCIPDHPRRCGAFPGFRAVCSVLWGSSPQVRGISPPTGLGLAGLGIIPAGAGHFAKPNHQSHPPGDHPRRCGAFVLYSPDATRLAGSSPQVRGIYIAMLQGYGGLGIIPAGAGHLSYGQSAPRVAWDHPRRCGAFTRNLEH